MRLPDGNEAAADDHVGPAHGQIAALDAAEVADEIASGRLVTVLDDFRARLEDAFTASPADRARVLRIGLPDRYVTHGKPALHPVIQQYLLQQVTAAAANTRNTISNPIAKT